MAFSPVVHDEDSFGLKMNWGGSSLSLVTSLPSHFSAAPLPHHPHPHQSEAFFSPRQLQMRNPSGHQSFPQLPGANACAETRLIELG